MTDLALVRTRAEVLLQDLDRAVRTRQQRTTIHRVQPFLPALLDGLATALSEAHAAYRTESDGSYEGDVAAVVAIRLATLRLLAQMRLVAAAVQLCDETVALRERQIQVALQRATMRADFLERVDAHLAAIRLARTKRETEIILAEIARTEAEAHLTDLRAALRMPVPENAFERTLEDRIASGDATDDELQAYRRKA